MLGDLKGSTRFAKRIPFNPLIQLSSQPFSVICFAMSQCMSQDPITLNTSSGPLDRK